MSDTIRTEPLYRQLASLLLARQNSRNGNAVWFERHSDRLARLVREYMPSGSGIDSGTKLDMDLSTADKLVFDTSFHHMDDSGGYDGWTEHTVTVRPSLVFGLSLSISGRDRNDIKDYLHECFDLALRAELPIDACMD